MMNFENLKMVIEDLKNGKMVIVTDDEKRENEGDLLISAEKATAEDINFMAKYGRGLICVPMSRVRADQLHLSPMVVKNNDSKRTAFTESVDYRLSSTGISAFERAQTAKYLADEKKTHLDFTRPGHVFPLVARDGGVLERAGHTEAAVDLMRMAELSTVGVICEIMNDDGTMSRLPDLKQFAREHDLKMISVSDLIHYRKNNECLIKRISTAKLPTRHGEFEIVGYREKFTGKEHVALVKGDVANGKTVLVRVHSECLTGDVFGSSRCDCGEQLDEALKRINELGTGVLLYMRQEGRGIGLVNKIRAYELQDDGLDTVDANLRLGFEGDLREYSTAAQMLSDLGIKSVNLMTNNPDKVCGLEMHGINVQKRVSIQMNHNEMNEYYLRTKKERMGHILDFKEERVYENL